MIGLFFDTETTGLHKGAEIVQIAAILQDTETWEIRGSLDLIVATDNPIPDKVAAIHGITDEIALKYGVPSGLAETLFTHLVSAADVVVAHNLAFDLNIISGVWKEADTLLAMKDRYCTMINGTNACKLPPGKYHGNNFQNHKPPKLVEAHRHFFGAEVDGAHDAMVDAIACRNVYRALQEKFEPICGVCSGLLDDNGSHLTLPAERHTPMPLKIDGISCHTEGCGFETPSLWRYEIHVIGNHLMPQTMPADELKQG